MKNDVVDIPVVGPDRNIAELVSTPIEITSSFPWS